MYMADVNCVMHRLLHIMYLEGLGHKNLRNFAHTLASLEILPN